MPRAAELLIAVALISTAAACSRVPRGAPELEPSRASVVLPSPQDVAARDLTADQQIRQAINRLTFGARPGDVERVRAMGVDRWIAAQLDPARIDDRATDQFVARFRTLSLSASELAREYPPPQLLLAQKRMEERRAEMVPGSGAGALELTASDSMRLRRARQQSQRVIAELQTATVARAVMSERQLQDVMVDFWENHFNIFAGKGAERYMLASYDRDVVRPHALGKFRDLLGAVAKSPAMLFYLDNWQSAAEPGRPVLAANGRRQGGAMPPRVGIGARRPGAGRFPYPAPPRAPMPNTPPTQVAQEPAAQRRLGLNENYGRELLELHTLGVDGGYTQSDVIAAARAFTGWTIDRPAQMGGFIFRPQMHDAGEKVFLGHTLKSGRGIEDGEEVLDIVARNPATAHFIATKLVRRFVSDSPQPALVERAAATFTRTDGDIRETLRTIFTSPEFFSTAAYKAKVKSPFELVVSALRAVGAEPDSTPRTAQIIARLGQPVFGHRDPNGYPETGDAWINTGSILERINFGIMVAAGRAPGVSLQQWARAEGLDTLSRDAQVDGVIRTILGGEASPDTRKVLEQGVNPLARNTPAGTKGLAQTIGLALGAPEFQRR